MTRVSWSPDAYADLREIDAWIARESQMAASRTRQRIRAAIQRLALFPDSGRVIPELPGGPYREVIVEPYRVMYRVEREQGLIIIVNIVHGKGRVPALDP